MGEMSSRSCCWPGLVGNLDKGVRAMRVLLAWPDAFLFWNEDRSRGKI
jgi:hypothetical protein